MTFVREKGEGLAAGQSSFDVVLPAGVPVGSTVFLALTTIGPPNPVVTGDGSNVWSVDLEQIISSTSQLMVLRSRITDAIAPGATLTVTMDSVSRAAWQYVEDDDDLELEASSYNAASSSNLTSGSTPATLDTTQLYAFGGLVNSGRGVTADPPWTDLPKYISAGPSGNRAVFGMHRLPASATGPHAATGSLSSSGTYGLAVLAMKGAPAGPPPGGPGGSVIVGGVKKSVASMSVIVGGVKKPVVSASVIVGGVKKPVV